MSPDRPKRKPEPLSLDDAEPLDVRPWWKTRAGMVAIAGGGLVVLVLAGMLLFGGGKRYRGGSSSGGIATSSTLTGEVLEAVTYATRLWDDFGYNAAAAEAKYGGKKVLVSGHVRYVKSAGGSYELGFQSISNQFGVSREGYESFTAQEKRWFNEGYPPAVVAHLTSSEKGKLAKLQPGATAFVLGRVRGRVDDLDWPKGYYVVMEDCVIADPPSKSAAK